MLTILCTHNILDDAPSDIQIAPPGRHTITPSDEEGKAVTLSVTIDQAAADALEACRASYQAAADAGEGDAPYLDFNHEDGAAAAWVKSIRWAGDDPQLGGIRADIEWSSLGEASVKGKTYRRFSPCLRVAKDTNKITGAPVNMGGIVNRAAFQKIQALFAKLSLSENKNQTIPIEKTKTMTDEEIAKLKSELEALKIQNEELQKQLKTQSDNLEAMKEEDAQAAVEDAVEEGKIKPDPEVKAKWKKMILSNPEAKTILAGLSPDPALSSMINTSAKAQPTEDDKLLLAKYDSLAGASRLEFFTENRDKLLKAKGQQ